MELEEAQRELAIARDKLVVAGKCMAASERVCGCGGRGCVQDDDEKEHGENKRTEKMHDRDKWRAAGGDGPTGDNQVLFEEKGEKELKLLASLAVLCPVPGGGG